MSDTTARKPGDSKADEHREQKHETGSDKAHPANQPGKQEKRLDEALEETFPSSDPVAVNITK